MAVREVVIAGAGVAGIEGLLRLRRLAGDRVRITLLSPEDEFVYRPLTVLEPFGRDGSRRYPLESLIAGTGASHIRDRLVGVDVSFRLVLTSDGRELHYDALLVALGAGQSSPYLHVALFTDRNRGETFTSIVTDLDEQRVESLAFVVPTGPVWTLPLYELALLTAHRAQASALPVQLTFVTPESRPPQTFGWAASDAIERLLGNAGIALFAGEVADVPEPGRLRLRDGELSADRIVALPRLIGAAVPGLPAGPGRFTPIDEYCRVPGTEGRVFAAGDAAAFPVKHGGLAAQQSDVAAAGIAHLAGPVPHPEPLEPVVRGRLLTGDGPLYLVSSRTGGEEWSSDVHERRPWPVDDKVLAEELGPCLRRLAVVPVT